MTTNEVLATVATGEFTHPDIERSVNLWGVRFDKSLNAGFLMFNDGTILKPNQKHYDAFVAIHGIMAPDSMLWNLLGEMKGTVKVVLRKCRKLKDGRYPIAIRLTHNKKVKYIFTGYSALERECNEQFQFQLLQPQPLSHSNDSSITTSDIPF